MEIPHIETFGSCIKAARIKAGLGLRPASHAVGMSKAALDSWEQDHVESPDLARLQKLAILLDLDPVKLAELAGYDPMATLPPMRPYLRSRYPHLPAAAHKEIAAITRRYGIDPNGRGPAPGEDES